MKKNKVIKKAVVLILFIILTSTFLVTICVSKRADYSDGIPEIAYPFMVKKIEGEIENFSYKHNYRKCYTSFHFTMPSDDDRYSYECWGRLFCIEDMNAVDDGYEVSGYAFFGLFQTWP